jgi:Tfp pilus assembly protein PilV
MTRKNRGASLVETLVSVVLFASVSATATNIYLTFNHYYNLSLQGLERARTINQIRTTIRSSRISDMIFPPEVNNFGTPNGIVNSKFAAATVSSSWSWKVTGKYMARLEPQLYGLSKSNGICIPDLDAKINFDRETNTLSFRYSRTKEGSVLQCLGGGDQKEVFGTYTWKKVQEVEVVKSDDSGLTLWIRYGDNWYSLIAGETE